VNETAKAAKRRAAIHFSIAGVVIAALAVALSFGLRQSPPPPRHDPSYVVIYTVAFVPAQGVAEVTIGVTPRDGRVSELRLAMPADRYDKISGDGAVVREGDTVVWRPQTDRPQQLRYTYRINEQRASGGYDALMTPQWVVVRADDLIPPAAVRATKDADASARLVFRLPEGWGSVDTPYGRSKVANTFVVATPGRSFDRPMGWVVAGRIGARRDSVGKTQVVVAGPMGQDLRRLDTLAFLNILLPEYRSAFGDLPPKLLVVTAGDPMWRGGLSGPRSLFLHSGRPLVSENGSSTLVHEMTHVVTRIRGVAGADWIAEGLAEFYSIELNRRAGLLSEKRAGAALAWMREHGKAVESLAAAQSRRERTARAVVVFSELDAEIRKASGGKASLDTVVRDLMKKRTVSLQDLRRAAALAIGSESAVLASPLFD
jgi:hypothetical protein